MCDALQWEKDMFTGSQKHLGTDKMSCNCCFLDYLVKNFETQSHDYNSHLKRMKSLLKVEDLFSRKNASVVVFWYGGKHRMEDT